MVNITAVHMVGGSQHEHIGSVQWINPADQATGQSTRETMVEWINNGGVAKVVHGGSTADVGVVKAIHPYIRTYADGSWTDNLLALPRY